MTYQVPNLTINLAANVSVIGSQGVFSGTSGANPATFGNETLNAPNGVTISTSSGRGVFVGGGAANVNIVGGSISTTGSSNGQGIQASGSGGNVVVQATNVNISTQGAGAAGINASVTGGSLSIQSSGHIGTLAATASGINATTSGSADSVAITSSSSIDTAGNTSRGISVTSTASGNVLVTNSGAISTGGSGASGVFVQSTAAGGGGPISVANSGAITTEGSAAHGISAQQLVTASASLVQIDNTATITINGVGGARALFAQNSGIGNATITGSGEVKTTSAGNALGYGALATTLAGTSTIDYSGAVTTLGNDATGLRAISTSTGNATVHYAGSQIEVFGGNSDGIVANVQGGVATITAQGEIITHADNGTSATAYGIVALATLGPASVVFTGTRIDVDGSVSAALLARSRDSTGSIGNSPVSVSNTGELIARGTSGAGIRTQSVMGSQTVTNSGAITTFLNASIGIDAIANGGSITIGNTGAIQAGNGSGTNNDGISAVTNATGAIAITNGAAISTSGTADSDGITATASSGPVAIANSGAIHTVGATSRGIAVATGGTVTISDPDPGLSDDAGTMAIDTAQDATQAASAMANPSASDAGSIAVDNRGAISTVGTTADGIAATAASGNVSVSNSGATINASGGNSIGIHALTTAGSVSIDNDAASQIHGGSIGGMAIATGGATQMIHNAGMIDALSDRAIQGDANGSGGTFGVTNSGTVTGTVSASQSVVTLNNTGTWNLRHFADTDGDGIRDTLGIAVSDFGTSGVNTINNTGTLALLTHDGSATSLDSTGEYLPFGNPHNAIALHSPAQAQILGVATFNHSGVIDLQANPSAGDVLVISGGHTAGVDGGGVFVSNGGSLKLNTVLNNGGANATSDVLVVDATRVGTGGATHIAVGNAGGTGAQTASDGIPLVQVLNRSASAAGAFVLDGRAVAGAYDYLLFHGGSAAHGGDPVDGNWYLRSETSPSPPLPPQPPGPPQPPQPAVPLYRAEVGSYLANQAAALGMFVHTLHDRLGEVDFTERQRAAAGDSQRQGSGWARFVAGHVDSSAGAGQLDTDTNNALLQFGSDIVRWSAGDDRYLVGAMAGIGHSFSHTASSITGFRSEGQVNGYSVGVYGTWYQSASQATGWYADTWLQYGHYDNHVNGDFLPQETYHSATFAGSLEAGYAIEVARSEHYGWYVEPQAQIIATSYSGGNHTESNGTQISPDNASGVLTRLGARAYARALDPAMGRRIQPFVEFNWWHNTSDIAMTFNNLTQESSIPHDIAEFKLGAQAELGGRWTGWMHVAVRLGMGGDYHSYEGLLGGKYTW
jgi:autotransporter family porin